MDTNGHEFPLTEQFAARGLIDQPGIAAAFFNVADNHGFFARFTQYLQGLLRIRLPDDRDHPDAHIEDAVHLFVVDLAGVADELEERGWRPGRAVDHGRDILWQHARDVVVETAAGDVGKPLDLDRLHERLNRPQVTPVHGEEDVR